MQVKLLPCQHHHSKKKHALQFYEKWSNVCFSEKVYKCQFYSEKKHLWKLEHIGGVVKTVRLRAEDKHSTMDWYFTSETCNWLFMQLKTTLKLGRWVREERRGEEAKAQMPC